MAKQGELDPVLDEMLSVRGATAAALVTADGQVLASRSPDRALLERTAAIITSALAAGQALGELLAGAQDDDGFQQVTLIFGEGPIVLMPLEDGVHLMVLALESEHDLGRARLALRGSLRRMADAVLAD